MKLFREAADSSGKVKKNVVWVLIIFEKTDSVSRIEAIERRSKYTTDPGLFIIWLIEL